MMQRRSLLAVLTMLMIASSTLAQQYRTVENPLQEEFEYLVNTDLRPAIEVAGVRWNRLRVEPKEGKSLVAGEEIPTVLTVELENPTTDKAEVLLIALLEDEKGNQLARLEAGRIKVKGEQAEAENKKLKVDGAALRDTRKVWVYLEVTR